MSDFRRRLFEEHDQLHQRVEKLKAFIVSDRYEALPEVDRADLKEQLRHMEGYYSVLSRRTSRQLGNA